MPRNHQHLNRVVFNNLLLGFIISVIRMFLLDNTPYVMFIVPTYSMAESMSMTDRQRDRYFIDRKKVNPDLFVIEI